MKKPLANLIFSFFILVVISVIILFCFWEATHFDFINFDDNIYITQNNHVLSGLSLPNLRWAFSTGTGGHWHPLTWISHQMDASLFASNPFFVHAENILLHAINALLVFYLLNKLSGHRPLNILLTLIFALHPLRIESVVWTTERKDLLCMLWGLLAIIFYLKPTRKFYFISLLMFIFSLLCKPAAVILPLLLFCVDSFFNKPLKITPKIPFFILSLLFSVTTLVFQNKSGAVKSFESSILIERFSNASVNLLHYFSKTFWPHPVAIFYPYVTRSPGIGFISCLATALLLITTYRFSRSFFWGALWFIIALLPVIGIIQVGGQSIADRWTYWPHVGIAFATAHFFSNSEKIQRPYLKQILSFLMLGLVLLCGVKLKQELLHWKNSETLFRHTLAVTENNFLAHTNLGVVLVDQNKWKEAEQHYLEALRIHPQYLEAINNLGTLYARQGRLEEAIPYFRRVLMIQPQDTMSRYNLGLAYHESGQKLKAFIEWMIVAKNNPDYSPVWQSLDYMRNNDFNSFCELKTSFDSQDLTQTQAIFREWTFPPQAGALNQALRSLKECLEN